MNKTYTIMGLGALTDKKWLHQVDDFRILTLIVETAHIEDPILGDESSLLQIIKDQKECANRYMYSALYS